MTDDTIQIPAHSMGQAAVVLADLIGAYVGAIRPSDWAGTDAELTKYHQVTIALFLHQLLMRSQHKAQMAGILDGLAAELRAADAAEVEADG